MSRITETFVKNTNIAEDGSLVLKLDLDKYREISFMLRVTYETTSAAASGVSVTGRVGAKFFSESDFSYDNNATPIDFGDADVTLDQSEEQVSVLHFYHNLENNPPGLELTLQNKDALVPAKVELFGIRGN